jgi:hypothetical protein
MATRSHIGVRNTDGTVDYIYCHWDGYPEHNGKILIDHYADMDKVNALMKLGNVSILGPEIGEKHDFDSLVRDKNWCRAYGRDRKYTDQQVKTTQFADLLKDDSVDYIYVFDGDYWECFDTYDLERDINLYTMFIHNTASDGI